MEMQPPFVAIATKAPGTYKDSWAPDPPRRPLLFVGPLDHAKLPPAQVQTSSRYCLNPPLTTLFAMFPLGASLVNNNPPHTRAP